ncbi:PilX N-terminal domain-containing pilus assembly protein [Arenimonas sp.]|uniref:PilX N-terminal domain-containing pilus assembly protein n=1 Tax=Arenimonas sp. TaxID=1872635 RepID=UPI0025C113D3|nr:PilX N-terminal domain-containing pilus assembly protein [Arenimonas sp.]
MTSHPIRQPRLSGHPRHQRGVVLYVALILLLLLTLLGVAGVQVASMQERMASAWRASNIAFQNSESANREREMAIANAPAAANPDDERCAGFDAAEWAEDELDNGEIDGTFVQRIDQCLPGGGLALGVRPESENTNLQFQVTAFATDVANVGDERTAEAVIDTIFIP